MIYPKEFEVIVIGSGHAGVEAAAASARMGRDTLFITHNLDTIGQLSCNPSIGGIGKGHLVKELDAMGGLMGVVTDEAGIQFRILNSSKGPAVRATRAQIDRQLYRRAMRMRIENQPHLWLFQQAVDDVVVENGRITGVVTQTGIIFRTKAAVLCAGTFLNGMVHIGLEHYSAGRVGDPSSIRLAERLKELKLPQGRLKTGTPARIDGRSIDFSKCQEQWGDLDPVPSFSLLKPAPVSGFLRYSNMSLPFIMGQAALMIPQEPSICRYTCLTGLSFIWPTLQTAYASTGPSVFPNHTFCTAMSSILIPILFRIISMMSYMTLSMQTGRKIHFMGMNGSIGTMSGLFCMMIRLIGRMRRMPML